MEEELRTNYPTSKIRLIEGDGGAFDVRYDGKLIYSKQNIEGRRFPNKGEITALIRKDMG